MNMHGKQDTGTVAGLPHLIEPTPLIRKPYERLLSLTHREP